MMRKNARLNLLAGINETPVQDELLRQKQIAKEQTLSPPVAFAKWMERVQIAVVFREARGQFCIRNVKQQPFAT